MKTQIWMVVAIVSAFVAVVGFFPRQPYQSFYVPKDHTNSFWYRAHATNKAELDALTLSSQEELSKQQEGQQALVTYYSNLLTNAKNPEIMQLEVKKLQLSNRILVASNEFLKASYDLAWQRSTEYMELIKTAEGALERQIDFNRKQRDERYKIAMLANAREMNQNIQGVQSELKDLNAIVCIYRTRFGTHQRRGFGGRDLRPHRPRQKHIRSVSIQMPHSSKPTQCNG